MYVILNEEQSLAFSRNRTKSRQTQLTSDRIVKANAAVSSTINLTATVVWVDTVVHITSNALSIRLTDAAVAITAYIFYAKSTLDWVTRLADVAGAAVSATIDALGRANVAVGDVG